VSDGTAAAISAAVKAVVRNSFIKLSYVADTVTNNNLSGSIVPARISAM
jgi:hypothetical protein